MHRYPFETIQGQLDGSLVPARLKRFYSKCPVRALADITGGSFVGKISCALPRNVDVLIREGSWDRLPSSQIVVEKGDVTDAELYQVFSMGVGVVAVVGGGPGGRRAAIHPRTNADCLAYRRSGNGQGGEARVA